MLDWQQFQIANAETPDVVDPRRRLGICLAGFVVAMLIVFGRVVQLEVAHGDEYREEALRPIERKTIVSAVRGRILTSDGVVLAGNRTTQAVAVAYRWLQDPPDEAWLRQKVRSRMPKRDRRNPAKFAAEKQRFLAERTALMERTARLCNLSSAEWQSRAKQIENRVEHIADLVNRPREENAATPNDASWTARLRQLFFDAPPFPRIEVAEQREHHVMADGVPQAVVAEITQNADQWPGVKIVPQTHRVYPQKTLAAHVVGHLGPASNGSGVVGRMGVERQYDALLQGEPGESNTQIDHAGRVLGVFCVRPPTPGRDVVLTLNAGLQKTAEQLLQSVLERSFIGTTGQASADASPGGGAIVAMNVEDGSILAAASAPTFAPNLFEQPHNPRLTALLADPTHPLFSRATHMAIAPGGVFEMVTAAAYVESHDIDPAAVFTCQGRLQRPDGNHADLIERSEHGHGDITLADALARNCNVYFWHYSETRDPTPLVEMARRLGFGRTTGVDLPDEAAGKILTPETLRKSKRRAWQTSDTQAMAIGQGPLTVTPMQMLCAVAAIADGGRTITPHVLRDAAAKQNTHDSDAKRLFRRETGDAVAEGLRRTVTDPHGVGYATIFMETIPIAGKLGTAETDDDRPASAWFAGYAPAEHPRVAFVIVLEHGGDAAATAGPVAKRMALRLEQLGLLSN